MAHDFQQDIDTVQAIGAVARILDVVCRMTGMGFAAVARVTEGRWICCAVKDDISFGLKPGGELEVATTICDEIRQSGEPVIIDEVKTDQIYCGHLTPAKYGFQSYISMPIVLPSGEFFGTLCAIDPYPRTLKNLQTIETFRLFAELIATHLVLMDRLAVTEGSLATERRDAELREQFIAVLGHDLRNPLASIQAGIRVARRPNADLSGTFDMMHASTVRMAKLVDNVMDLARAKLGGGLNLDVTQTDLQPILNHVIDELRSAHPGREVLTQIDVQPVMCDGGRIGQMLSNLLANALSHGADEPVTVSASTKNGLELVVANRGVPIPEEARANLFKPFYRGKSVQGLGLGLYICDEIAKAHGGEISVSSTADETKFAFKM